MRFCDSVCDCIAAQSLTELGDDDELDDEAADAKSPSQSNNSAQLAQSAPAQPQTAPTQTAAADDWADFQEPQQTGGGGGFQQPQQATAQDSQGWDPFTPDTSTPQQAAPQTQPAQNTATGDMGEPTADAACRKKVHNKC